MRIFPAAMTGLQLPLTRAPGAASWRSLPRPIILFLERKSTKKSFKFEAKAIAIPELRPGNDRTPSAGENPALRSGKLCIPQAVSAGTEQRMKGGGTMDAADKPSWVMENILDDGEFPWFPTPIQGKERRLQSLGIYEFIYDEEQGCFICPQGRRLRHATARKGGKRFCRSTSKDCRNRPCRKACGASTKGQRGLMTRI